MLNQDTTLNIGIILALIGAISTIYNMTRSSKQDKAVDVSKAVENAKENATEFTRLNVKLDVLSQQFAELIRSNEKTLEKISQLNSELAEAFSRIKLLFEYKDQLERRIERLEGGKYDNPGRNEKSADHNKEL